MRKIEYACAAASLFIQHLHTENFDRGMIATFGNTFRVEQPFTGNERLLHATLQGVMRSVTNEATRLYDSIADVIESFWDQGDRKRPWLLTVITDGKNYFDGGAYGTPTGIGRRIATRYNQEASNFMFLIGVGEGDNIDVNALNTVGNYGGIPTITIEAFPLLELVFLKIALEVSTRVVGTQVNVGSMTWQEVTRIRQISQTPIDYAFLIDRSGSMNDSGD
ncbi:MAG: hypothetical protein OJF49_004215 [Ktedonobacterales bacterium]|nr:MAG: hypothetical protein OJF49_004215 [Ktedonobacterales bacterium]